MSSAYNTFDVDDQLAEDFHKCGHAATYSQQGGRYARNMNLRTDGENSEWAIRITEGNVHLFGLFCGYKGGRGAACYAMNRMVFEIFRDQPITSTTPHHRVLQMLEEKFRTVDRRYKQQLEVWMTDRLLAKESEKPNMEEEISRLESQIRGGCTVLIILQIDDILYILNCGTSQAIVLTSDERIVQLTNAAHTNENAVEIERLQAIGVDPAIVTQPTRGLGDGFRSYLYEELPEFKHARRPVVIAEPDITTATIEGSWKHLIMFSGGVIQNLRDCEVDDIFLEIKDKFHEGNTPTASAQTLVHNFVTKHAEAFERSTKRHSESPISNRVEEMTVVYVKLNNDRPEGIEDPERPPNGTLPETETFSPYVDMDSKIASYTKHIEKFLLNDS